MDDGMALCQETSIAVNKKTDYRLSCKQRRNFRRNKVYGRREHLRKVHPVPE